MIQLFRWTPAIDVPRSTPICGLTVIKSALANKFNQDGKRSRRGLQTFSDIMDQVLQRTVGARRCAAHLHPLVLRALVRRVVYDGF